MSVEFDIKNGVLTKISNLTFYKTPWLKSQQGIVKVEEVLTELVLMTMEGLLREL